MTIRSRIFWAFTYVAACFWVCAIVALFVIGVVTVWRWLP